MTVPAPLSRTDPYAEGLRRLSLLSPSEERALARRYVRTHDPRTGHRLIEAHLRLVMKIAHEYRWSGQDLRDLVQAGNLGLVLALEKFDPRRGVRLSTYAAWWIRASIRNFAVDNLRLVRVGVSNTRRQALRPLRAERARLEALGQSTDLETLAALRGVSPRGLTELEQHLTLPELSLDEPRAGDREGPPRLQLLRGDESSRPDLQVEAQEHQTVLRETIAAFARGLHGRDRLIFDRRFLRDTPVTLAAIGKRLGISRERVRQLEKRLLVRLRVFLEAETGETPELLQAAA